MTDKKKTKAPSPESASIDLPVKTISHKALMELSEKQALLDVYAVEISRKGVEHYFALEVLTAYDNTPARLESQRNKVRMFRAPPLMRYAAKTLERKQLTIKFLKEPP